MMKTQILLVWLLSAFADAQNGGVLVRDDFRKSVGREEKDRTPTIAILPLETSSVQLRLTVRARQIRGEFRPAGADAWQEVGTCDLPAPADGKAKVSLQAYQGSAQEEHWARITELQIRRLNP